MATRILKVEVENDFLNKVSNSGAYTAISELVWNSLDADASTVKVKLCEDAIMGGWDKLQVIDDGIGISNKVADKHFSKLGGSWKKFAQKTKKGRFLHGQEGQGRFKPFSLGRIIDWNTVYLEENQQELQSLVITGKSEEIGNFTLNDGSPKDELRHTGTTVTISELTSKGLKVSENGLINYISCAFAIYLAKYPTISLYVNDKKIDPAEYVEHEDTIDLPSVIFEEESYAYSLKVIEWKCDTKNELNFRPY